MRRQLKFYSILAAFVVAVCFAIAFTACYYIGEKNIPPVQFQGKVFQTDPILGFARIPNASGHRHERSGIDYDIYTNALGARVNTPREATPEKADIVTIGCSFSEGQGIANEQTFTSILSRKLHATALNFAVNSYSGVGAMLMLKRLAGLHPKIIIYGLVEEHLRLNVSPCLLSMSPFCMSGPYIEFDKDNKPFIHPVTDDNLRAFQMTIKSVALASHRNIFTTAWYGMELIWYSHFGSLLYHAAPKRTEEQLNTAFQYTIAGMKAAADQMGASLVVVNMPTMRLDWAKPFNKARLIPEGVHFIDTTDALTNAMRAQHKRNFFVVPANPHPSAEAHAIIADEIAKYIEAHKLLPPAVP